MNCSYTEGFYNISTTLTLGCEFDLSSEGLKEKATEEGLYQPGGDPFNFADVFSEPQRAPGDDADTPDRREKGRKLLEKLTAKSKYWYEIFLGEIIYVRYK